MNRAPRTKREETVRNFRTANRGRGDSREERKFRIEAEARKLFLQGMSRSARGRSKVVQGERSVRNSELVVHERLRVEHDSIIVSSTEARHEVSNLVDCDYCIRCDTRAEMFLAVSVRGQAPGKSQGTKRGRVQDEDEVTSGSRHAFQARPSELQTGGEGESRKYGSRKERGVGDHLNLEAFVHVSPDVRPRLARLSSSSRPTFDLL